MIFEADLQVKDHYRRANDPVIPAELLSTLSSPTSLYGFVAHSYTCLALPFGDKKIQAYLAFLPAVFHTFDGPSSSSFPDLTVSF